MKKVLPWLLVAVLAFVALSTGVYFYNKLQSERAAVREAALRAEIAVLDERLASLDAALAALRAENKQLQDDAARDRAALRKRLDDLKKAQPTELVAEGRRILRTEEINLLPSGIVEFSLAAYRTNVETLVDWEDAILRREPNFRAQIATLTQTTALQDESIKAWAAKYGKSEQAADELRRQLRSLRVKGYVQMGIAGIAGYGIGKGLEFLFGRKG